MVKIIRGAHNALTSLSVKNWWGIFGLPIARCQTKMVQELIGQGILCFDIRVYWDKKSQSWQPAHGLINFQSYHCNPNYIPNVLVALRDNYLKHSRKYGNGKAEKFWVRVILEKGNEKDEIRFKEFCHWLSVNFRNGINFIGGYKKKGWKRLYSFYNNDYTYIEQQVSSMDPRAKGKWYKYFPIAFAKRFTMRRPWLPINEYPDKATVIILRDFC